MAKFLSQILSLVAAVSSAVACSCEEASPCSKVGTSAVIFTGIPLHELSALEPWKPVRFKVEQPYRGLSAGTRLVEVDTYGGSSCRWGFTKGAHYLVYAAELTQSLAGYLIIMFRRVFLGPRTHPTLVLSSACHGSRLLSHATEDLGYLRRWLRRETAGTIQGRVNPDTGYGGGLYESRRKQLTGSVVTVGKEDGHVLGGSTSDENGWFSIAPLPPGRYWIKVSQQKFRSSLPAQPLLVPERGCAEISVPMTFDDTN
jgi:hypothetical protein